MSDGRTRAQTAGLPPLVLFDLDDTLFDDRHSRLAGLRRVRAEAPIFSRIPLRALSEEYGRLLEAGHLDVTEGRISKDDSRSDRFERLAMFCGRMIPAERARRLSRNYHAAALESRRAVPGSAALLARIRRHSKVGVITNNLRAEQIEKLAAIGLSGTIDALVTSEEVGYSKPDPRIFEIALERTGVSAEEAVMVGNSWESDVRGARAAGIRPVWLNRFGEAPPERANVTELTSFRPVTRALQRIQGI